jgi:hypothetical protein
MYNNKISVIMKSFLNYSKLAIAMLITSSVFVACSDEITENSVDIHYTANTSNIKSAGQAVDLGLPSGTKWANMNVGATSESDNGILFVWGDITGSQMNATTPTSYLDVKAQTSLDDLFDLYKGADVKVGTICDTTNISKIVEPKLIDLSFIGDTTQLDSLSRATIDAQKMQTIISFVKDKINNAMTAESGFLEATLTNEDFTLIVNWDGSKFIERFPSQKSAKDTLDYFKKFEYANTSTFSVDEIGSTEVNFYESPKANSYTEIKDQLGVVSRKDYNGGDISNIPVYSIVADAEHDPATANWGNNWSMPTAEQFQELLDNCNWEFVGNGYKVSSKVEGNNNSIFLPAAGYRFGEKWYGNGNAGYYATGDILGTYHFPSMAEQNNGSKGAVNGNENMPNMLIFQHGQYNSLGIYNNLSSSYGVSIRPVTK